MLKIAFTGHRPDKLPGGYDWESDSNQKLCYVIEKVVSYLVSKQPSFCLYTGGALGVDQMVVYHFCGLQLDKPMKQHMALPYAPEILTSKWNQRSKDAFNHLMQQVDEITIVDQLPLYDFTKVEGYKKEKLQIRNQFLVDQSHLLIAVWDGSPSGTKNCIDYALNCGKIVIMINPKNYLVRRI